MRIAAPAFHPGVLLKDLYLDPAGLSAGKLARLLNLPRTRIERLLKGETAMTVDTAMRLARFFETSPQYWLNMQTDYDLQQFATNQQGPIDIQTTYAELTAATAA
ncbi:HigA family addiction module antitoxin [Pannonibacter sp.]|uniref:HigA family addiction module antitoxin n=1 Tax=Pannonibacter sp. TaxID=1906786 RepID=UPI003F724995